MDEFVPQFYDAGPERAASGIAEVIDAEKWAPIFNALGTPYRIGISSFGRVARRRANSSGVEQVMYFRDARPFDFAGKKLHIFPGASGDWHGRQARRAVSCVESALKVADWAVPHQYRFYAIAVLATYAGPPGSEPLPAANGVAPPSGPRLPNFE